MPERRPRVGTVERIVLTVPDPVSTAEFLADGLDFDVRDEDGTILVVCEGEYASGRGQAGIELARGADLRVHELVFAVPDEVDLTVLESIEGAARVTDTAVRLADPVSDLVVRLERESSVAVPSPAHSVLRPRRMGHVNLKARRPATTASFFTDVLGLRLSERIGEDLYWMRTHTEHHNVALRPGQDGDLHHVGMEVAGWHQYQTLLDRLDDRGYKVEYGPGRHRPGRSLFVYLCDPHSGLRIELFADMVHITDPARPPIAWEPGARLTTTLNTWGPQPPESFLA